MEYNTTRNKLAMREYGRHVQKMIEYIQAIEDPEKRQKNAYAVIELMGFLNPHLKNVEDFRHKLWDHLFLISDFKLEVESPYNTYRVSGLPPGPIRIPSVAAIDAVLSPQEHNYLFMCAKDDLSGRHNFAITHAEHSRNAARYQQALNRQGIYK